MKSALKLVLALTATTVLMLALRALAFTVYTVKGTALEPYFADGDHVLVGRWSYGLRTGGAATFGYARWAARPVRRGELVVFNSPADTLRPVHRRETMAYYCTAVPGDTVATAEGGFVVPGRGIMVCVTEENMRRLCGIYNMYEGRRAAITDGRLTVDGRATAYATFAHDYYIMSPSRPAESRGTAHSVLVPETHVIGRVMMMLYSIDKDRLMPHVRIRLELQ